MVPSLRAYFAMNGIKHLVLILWFCVNALTFYYTFMYYYTGVQFYYLHQMLGYGLCISRASAACINMNSGILLVPMCKRLMTYIRGFKQVAESRYRRVLDCGRSFHICGGYLLCLLAIIHCGAHVYNAIYFSKHFNEKYHELNVAKYADQHPLIMLVTTLPGITGLLLVATLMMIAIFASKPIRLKNYNQFWKTHHLFAIYYILLFLHSLDGVIKYQSNTKEHVPGCYMIISPNNSRAEEPVVMPEPEPHAEPFSLNHREFFFQEKRAEENYDVIMESSKHVVSPFMDKTNSPVLNQDLLHRQVVIPEPEPMLQSDAYSKTPSSENSTLNASRSLMSTKQCEQPPPEFRSCPREVWRWICVPLALYFAERLVRIFCSSRNAATVEDFKIHPDDVIELRLSQSGFCAKPGQTVLVRCPSISQVELHSFSLTSVPHKDDPSFGLHIKVLGDWTKRLRESLLQQTFEQKRRFSKKKLSPCPSTLNCSREDFDAENSSICKTDHVTPFRSIACESENCNYEQSYDAQIYESYEIITKNSSRRCEKTKNHLLFTNCCHEIRSESFINLKPPQKCNFPIYIEGPFGSAMEDIYKYKVSLCVAGGIGITPFASVLNKFLKDQSTWDKTKLQRLYIFWACKSITSFHCLSSILESLQLKLWKENRPDFLSVQLFVTGNADTESTTSSSRPKVSRCAVTFSRPNFEQVICDVSQRHPKTTVGVFSCGPRSLITALKKSCLHVPARNKTKFVFNKEAF